MANLQVKGLEEDFYEELKRLATEENRSLSQQVVFMLRQYLAKRGGLSRVATPADVLLRLAGSWEDDRGAGDIVYALRQERRNSAKLGAGF